MTETVESKKEKEEQASEQAANGNVSDGVKMAEEGREMSDDNVTESDVEKHSEESRESNVEELNKKSKTESENEDFKKKFYYLAAEMENMKRRTSKEKENLIKFGNEKILSALLDVVDNLERTVQAIGSEEDEKIKNIANGIKMVHGQFIDVLEKNGLNTVEAVGKPFDPRFHEAMAHQPMEGKDDDEIISEYQKGYVLNGRLLRASKVIVVKN
ncbi:MAG: nucleotide exchange factor GrpE [Halobacteriovoraceae bacterium]|nr:nucleotide exchange factor GrpE [Halobacteriovoraceae bacterium]|tara:strand:+ start:1689 stop:2330 length:642 start_codon:yes stop_codon:yes gene_type:complete